MRFAFRAMAVWFFLGCLGAQPLKFIGRQVTIIEPEHTEDGFPKGPAMVCLEGPPRRQCYTAPKDYGNNPTITPVQLRKDQLALLFSAESGGVSGWSVHFALLGPGLEDLLVEDVSVSNQNQHTFWNDPTISEGPIFLVAEATWGPEETNHGFHRYVISVYMGRPVDDPDETPTYWLGDRYMTVRKYDMETADILAAEKPEILFRLRRVKSAR